MRDKIIIDKSYVENRGGVSRLVFDLTCESNDKFPQYSLFYQVDNEYKEFLTYEVADSCIVCLLLYAMQHGFDIVSKVPISERLHKQLTEYLIPAISRNIKIYHQIDIKADKVNFFFNSDAVGAGLSCGVDSFYSILKNLKHGQESELNITHLCFFNAGATGMFGGEEARCIFEERGKSFRNVADKIGCKFLICDSNMNEFLHQEHEMTHTFRTLSIPLALQKLFHLYYFASSYEYNCFKFSSFDTSYYDILTLPNLSNQNIRFELVGGETTRQGKVSYISEFPVTYNALNVCINGITNCCTCRKCRRTMLNLYLAGKLDKYESVFNVNWFYANKRKLIRWALMNFWRVDLPEIIRLLRIRKEINATDYIISAVQFPVSLIKQIIGKINFKRNNR